MNDNSTILYVDDEFINLQLFELNFRKKYNILLADSGYKGLEIFKANPHIDIVISDMKMPGMNGIDFIKEVKKIKPEISCYILTGFDVIDEIQEALDCKLVKKYFSKPFNIFEIESAISNN